MTQRIKLFICVLGLFCGTLLLVQSADSTTNTFSIPWYSFDGGGRRSQNSMYEIAGSTGQPDAGELGNGEFTINGGFWHTSYELMPEDEYTPPAGFNVYFPLAQ